MAKKSDNILAEIGIRLGLIGEDDVKRGLEKTRRDVKQTVEKMDRDTKQAASNTDEVSSGWKRVNQQTSSSVEKIAKYVAVIGGAEIATKAVAAGAELLHSTMTDTTDVVGGTADGFDRMKEILRTMPGLSGLVEGVEQLLGAVSGLNAELDRLREEKMWAGILEGGLDTIEELRDELAKLRTDDPFEKRRIDLERASQAIQEKHQERIAQLVEKMSQSDDRTRLFLEANSAMFGSTSELNKRIEHMEETVRFLRSVGGGEHRPGKEKPLKAIMAQPELQTIGAELDVHPALRTPDRLFKHAQERLEALRRLMSPVRNLEEIRNLEHQIIAQERENLEKEKRAEERAAIKQQRDAATEIGEKRLKGVFDSFGGFIKRVEKAAEEREKTEQAVRERNTEIDSRLGDFFGEVKEKAERDMKAQEEQARKEVELRRELQLQRLERSGKTEDAARLRVMFEFADRLAAAQTAEERKMLMELRDERLRALEPEEKTRGGAAAPDSVVSVIGDRIDIIRSTERERMVLQEKTADSSRQVAEETRRTTEMLRDIIVPALQRISEAFG